MKYRPQSFHRRQSRLAFALRHGRIVNLQSASVRQTQALAPAGLRLLRYPAYAQAPEDLSSSASQVTRARQPMLRHPCAPSTELPGRHAFRYFLTGQPTPL